MSSRTAVGSSVLPLLIVFAVSGCGAGSAAGGSATGDAGGSGGSGGAAGGSAGGGVATGGAASGGSSGTSGSGGAASGGTGSGGGPTGGGTGGVDAGVSGAGGQSSGGNAGTDAGNGGVSGVGVDGGTGAAGTTGDIDASAGGSGNASGSGGASGSAQEAGTGSGGTGSGGTGTGGAPGTGGSTAVGPGSDGGADATTCSSGNAVLFAAAGSDVYLPNIDATPSSGFTWEFWFDGAQLPTTSSVDITKGATMLIAADQPHYCEDIYVGFGTEFTAANELAFNVDGSGLCAARDTAAIHYAPAGGFYTGRWYFVAVSHDYTAQESRLYLDGALVASKSSSVAAIPYVLPVSVGRWTDRGVNTYNQFYGAIDELRIYGRVLSPAEISGDYANGAGRYGTSSESGLVAGYHFDEGSGQVAADFGTSGDSGALEGGASWGTGLVCGPSTR